jgi:hypothetical protein
MQLDTALGFDEDTDHVVVATFDTSESLGLGLLNAKDDKMGGRVTVIHSIREGSAADSHPELVQGQVGGAQGRPDSGTIPLRLGWLNWHNLFPYLRACLRACYLPRCTCPLELLRGVECMRAGCVVNDRRGVRGRLWCAQLITAINGQPVGDIKVSEVVERLHLAKRPLQLELSPAPFRLKLMAFDDARDQGKKGKKKGKKK